MSHDTGHSVALPAEPDPLGPDYAVHLRLSKQRLLEGAPQGAIPQTGGAYVGGQFPVPPVPAGLWATDPAIETFVVDPNGGCTPTGTDESLIDHLGPPAEALAAAMLQSAATLGIALDHPIYLSGSVTPLADVTTTPHVDDDQYVETEGVGLVAIAADVDGPCLATNPIPHRTLRSGLPLEFDDEVLADFGRGRLSSQRAEAERIVVFPQFGQLHAGPVIDPAEVGTDRPPFRTLLVLRARTIPGGGSYRAHR